MSRFLGLGLFISAVSGAPPFVPTNLSGLVSWHRADLGITTSGSNVTAWSDQSGNGFDFSIHGTPTLTTASSSYGNKNVVSTSGATSYVFRASTPNTAQPVSVIWIGKASASAGNLALGLGTISGPFVESSGSNALLFAGASLSTSLDITTPAAFYFELNSTTSRVCRNNWLTGGTSGNAGTQSLGGLGIGISSDQNSSFTTNADCAELIVYNRILNSTEQSQVATYVSGRYGFTIT